MSHRVLAISAHPDDETLGCGGTLLKHRHQGDKLFWMVVTQAHAPQWSSKIIAQKSKEVDLVGKAYGMSSISRLGFPSSELEKVSLLELMARIRDILAAVKPDIVYLVNPTDVHSDHRIVFTAVMGVLKPFYMSRFGVRRILCFETLSSTEAAPAVSEPFRPQIYSDISSYLEPKLKILRLYKTEIQADPMPRGPSAVRALARYRGATIGASYAEAFMLVREYNPDESTKS